MGALCSSGRFGIIMLVVSLALLILILFPRDLRKPYLKYLSDNITQEAEKSTEASATNITHEMNMRHNILLVSYSR